jgi:DNA-binding beta-propeller fold protein YncE
MSVRSEVIRRSLGTLSIAVCLSIGCGGDPETPPDGAGAPVIPSAGGAAGSATTSNPIATPTPTTPTPMNPNSGIGTTPPNAMGAAGSSPSAPITPMKPDPAAPAPTTPTPTPNDPMTMAPMPTDLPVEMGTPTLFWLDIAANLVTTAAADGSGSKRFASGSPLSAPDGVTVDPAGGHVFVLNMGSLLGGARNGSLVRYKLDGSSPEVIMKPGSMADGQTFDTGKQITIDKINRKLYMGDREGSKVWRCDYDGKNLEVLVSGHMIQQVVGVAADPIHQKFYFSDRNGRKIFRANMKMPDGQTHANRDDLELLYLDKAANAMPLDLELDIEAKMIYWTDRDQNKVFAMSMDMPAGSDGMTRTDVKTVASNLLDVIGLGYDHEEGMLYVTHSGSVSRFKTDGTGLERIGSSGSTGITFARIP